ncbi:P-loop containing nucleoside triphosphate hydrolase protein [Zychaea mexicana]|uniref:P-loop containing nucleoside triphosphate hydrolase protein n=1 Tax=Zychaea mexicana TaxID=64656 RepID=UPI0022FDC991|nr:P-loop containing nucleoside triphosphate hydrolase protein [Zychaea mexicana]KAI9484779.1 P-loop containing nucleoside triphosphate hydrolase protein [Zychaea mexicana]
MLRKHLSPYLGNNVQAFHGGHSKEDKIRITQDFLNGNTSIVVATNAFGTGVDHPSIRLVVHVSGSASVLDYAQETGRAGRDGRVAFCVLLASKMSNHSDPNNDDESTWAGFRRKINNSVCIRKTIQSELDPYSYTCFGYPNAQTCSICHTPKGQYIVYLFATPFYFLYYKPMSDTFKQGKVK